MYYISFNINNDNLIVDSNCEFSIVSFDGVRFFCEKSIPIKNIGLKFSVVLVNEETNSVKMNFIASEIVNYKKYNFDADLKFFNN